MIKKLSILIFFLLSIMTYGLEYSVEVTPNSGTIGDVFTYKLHLTYEENETLVSIPSVSLFDQFHIQDKSFKKHKENGQWLLDFVVDFQIFDTEEHVIPEHSIKYKKTVPKTITIAAIPIPIERIVTSDELEIDDLKPLPRMSLDRKVIALIIGGVLCFVLLIVGAIVYLKKHTTNVVSSEVKTVVDPRTPKQRALDGLTTLLDKRLIESQQFKLFYTELVEILKLFLFETTTIDVIDMTTEETLVYLRDAIEPTLLRQLKDILNYSDMVKFSKFQAGTSDHLDMITKVKEIIMRVADAD